jgi:hypothetical protein
MRGDGELMDETPAGARDEANASIAWTGTVLASFGRGLICLDAGFRVLHASPFAEQQIGSVVQPGSLAEAALGEHLFGRDGLLRRALGSGEHRARWTGRLAAGDGSAATLTVSAAALSDGGQETGVAYAVLIGPPGEDDRWNVQIPVDFDPAELHVRGRSADRDELRAVLDHYHWQRAEAARALGISRTTLWRKMREVGLI